MKKLHNIFLKHGCDKGTKHPYAKVYEKDMKKLKDEEINICEIGIFKGSSIEAWVDYFPNANIYGVDTFQRIKPEEIEILNHPRVHWLEADSLKAGVSMKARKAWGDVKFDYIIDDGMHTPEANAKTFENFIHLLKDDGVYYIEDTFPIDIMTMDEMNIDWIRQRSDSYNMLKMNQFLNSISSYKVTRHDMRKEAKTPDSYIFRIEK